MSEWEDFSQNEWEDLTPSQGVKPLVAEREKLSQKISNLPSQIGKSFMQDPMGFVSNPAMKVVPQLRDIGQSVNYGDMYRQSNLPGSKTSSVGGQFAIGMGGEVAKIASDPYAWAIPEIIKSGAIEIPAFRRFLQTQTPNLANKLLKTTSSEVEPIYKTINGIQVDINKPLPNKTNWLVKQGRTIIDKVNNVLETKRGEYNSLVKPSYGNEIPVDQVKVATAPIPKNVQKVLGIDTTKIKTVKDLWELRWDVRKTIDDPWKKAELDKLTNFKEEQVMSALEQMKAVVMNNVDDATRKGIDVLDPQFEMVIKSSRGIKSALFDPATNKINTTRLVNIFKNPTEAGTREWFDNLSYFDKSINKVGGSVKWYANRQVIKKVVGTGIGLTAVEEFLRWRMRDVMRGNPGGGY